MSNRMGRRKRDRDNPISNGFDRVNDWPSVRSDVAAREREFFFSFSHWTEWAWAAIPYTANKCQRCQEKEYKYLNPKWLLLFPERNWNSSEMRVMRSKGEMSPLRLVVARLIGFSIHKKTKKNRSHASTGATHTNDTFQIVLAVFTWKLSDNKLTLNSDSFNSVSLSLSLSLRSAV